MEEKKVRKIKWSPLIQVSLSAISFALSIILAVLEYTKEDDQD